MNGKFSSLKRSNLSLKHYIDSNFFENNFTWIDAYINHGRAAFINAVQGAQLCCYILLKMTFWMLLNLLIFYFLVLFSLLKIVMIYL